MPEPAAGRVSWESDSGPPMWGFLPLFAVGLTSKLPGDQKETSSGIIVRS